MSTRYLRTVLLLFSFTWMTTAALNAIRTPGPVRVALFVVDDITAPRAVLEALPPLFQELRKIGWADATRLGLVSAGPSTVVMDLGATPVSMASGFDKIATMKSPGSQPPGSGAAVAISMLSSIGARLKKVESLERLVIFVAGQAETTPEFGTAVDNAVEALRGSSVKVIVVGANARAVGPLMKLATETAGKTVTLDGRPGVAARAIANGRFP